MSNAYDPHVGGFSADGAASSHVLASQASEIRSPSPRCVLPCQGQVACHDLTLLNYCRELRGALITARGGCTYKISTRFMPAVQLPNSSRKAQYVHQNLSTSVMCTPQSIFLWTI